MILVDPRDMRLGFLPPAEYPPLHPMRGKNLRNDKYGSYNINAYIMFLDVFAGGYDHRNRGGYSASLPSSEIMYRELYLNQCDNMLLMQTSLQQQRLDQRTTEERIREQERIDRDRRKYEDRMDARNNKK